MQHSFPLLKGGLYIVNSFQIVQYVTKEKKGNLTVEKPNKSYLILDIKVNINSDESRWQQPSVKPSCNMVRLPLYHCGLLPPNLKSQCTNSDWGAFYEIRGQYSTMSRWSKTKKAWVTLSKNTKETWWLNVIWQPGTEKKLSE